MLYILWKITCFKPRTIFYRQTKDMCLHLFSLLDIDHCANISCQNGATCQNLETTYTCQCDVGYTGQLCDTSTYCLMYDSWLCLNNVLLGPSSVVSLLIKCKTYNTYHLNKSQSHNEVYVLCTQCQQIKVG